jgi:hypothetical protein
MNRLLIALLAAFDAAMAVGVGIVAALAPLTLLWALGFPDGAPWGALWPTAVTVWQAGHLVPVHVQIGADYAALAGIPAEATAFAFSLAPAAFAVFTAVFAARSGARAARAGGWATGVAVGTLTVAVLAALIAATARIELARVEVWAAVLLPAAVFGLPALTGALVRAWRDGDDGPLDRLRYRMDIDGSGVVEAAARGVAAVAMGLVGVGAAMFAIALMAGFGRVVSLFEASHVDLVGVIVVSLGQLAYLPTLIAWGAAYAAGPGFALGEGTAVSSSGTQLGVVPGIPVLGVVPENPSAWLLLSALLVVGVGALAGWIARVRLQEEVGDDESVRSRVVILAVVVAGAAGAAALLAWLSSGALGPGRLQHVGPDAGVLALVVAVEVALGAAAVLLAPARRPDAAAPAAPFAAEGSAVASVD